MMKGSRLVFTGLTHAAALLAGWGGWTAYRHFATGETQPAMATRDSSGSRRANQKTVDEMLAAFAAKAAAETAAAESHDWPRMQDHLRDEFAQTIATTSISGDFEAAVEAEMATMKDGETPSMKMGALLYFWALNDPLALMDWRGYEDGNRGKALWFHEEEIFRKLIAEKGLASLAHVLKHRPGGDYTTRTVARVFAKSADVRALGNLKQMSAEGWKRVRPEEIGELWPWTERSKLVNLAASEGSVEMIGNFVKSDAAKAAGSASWLLGLLRDESLDPGFREKLAKAEVLKEIARTDRELPLSDRVAMMNGGNPKSGKDIQNCQEFAWRDVDEVLAKKRDWNYEFRHEAVEATEVLAEISKELPELAAKFPDTLRDRIFKNLINEDPARAMRLLDPLPPDERAKKLLEKAKSYFYQSDPNLLLAALRLVPAEDPQLRDDRQQVWSKTTVYNFQDHDTAYADWVLALPESVDREMALRALAQAAEKTDPGLAAKVRAELKTPPK